MGDILQNAADYNLVRMAIDISLTTDALPDATIQLSTYLTAAEREAKRRDPDWATRVDDELAALKEATAYLAAARLTTVVPQIVQAKDGDLSRHLAERDMAAHRDDLRALADDALQTLTGGATRPTMFAAAPGSRGQ